ncbi:MAG TPA: PEP-utilizing enzyme [Acidimicrobiia bacterium]|nr:PEP-utilizing enzyme [Acidimicrobiia bacterium]
MDLHDPTNGTSEPTRYWSTANIGEAMPDVLSPMCWSFWGPNMEAGARLAYCDFGLLPRADLRVPSEPDELLVSYFYGRPAMNLDRLRSLFDPIPGMTADDFERDVCGTVRAGLPPVPKSPRTTLKVLARAPVAMARAGRQVQRSAAEQRVWWERAVHDGAGLDDPRRLLKESAARFREAFRAHVRARFVLMSFHAQLTKLADGAGRPDLVVRVLAGLGGVTETDVADDLWLVGADRLPLADFIRRHGFHGPLEGNVAGTSWRENPSSVLPLAKAMAARPADQRPRQREAAMVAARREAIAELKAALPASRRASVGLLCRAAARCVRTTEIGKAGFLMGLDGGRAATRALGTAHRAAGRLDEIDDACYLTIPELLEPLPDGVMDLVRFRRERREEYRRYELPLTFTGLPAPTLRAEDAGAEVGDVLIGVAGSPGTAEGTARVVVDPFDAEPLEPGEVLVCRFTDPGWAPLFSLADALVIDIGAAASHGAIVARELGVPCVIGTGDGTRRIRTGDRLRVDGSAGRVEILARAAPATDRGAEDGA